MKGESGGDVVSKKVEKLLALLETCPPSSVPAQVNAADLVKAYSDEDALAILRNTSDEELLQKPAFCRAILKKLEFA